MGAARRSVVLDPTPTSCGVDCVLVPGDVPGTSTRQLSTGPNRYTAENSIVWPDTLPNATMMLMRVTGVIPRAYVGSMTPSFAHLQGTTYKPIDADGAFSGSYCFGEIRTDFRIFGNREYTLRSCTLSNSNNDADNLVVADKAVVGRLKGSGVLLRTGMLQPSWPGWYNCLNGPCVMASEATQTITMHPWLDKLRLAASPTEVYEGDFGDLHADGEWRHDDDRGLAALDVGAAPAGHRRSGANGFAGHADRRVRQRDRELQGPSISHGEHVSPRESESGHHQRAGLREGGGQAPHTHCAPYP